MKKEKSQKVLLSGIAMVVLFILWTVAINDSASSGNAGGKPIRNPEREKPQWEDTITNRMIH